MDITQLPNDVETLKKLLLHYEQSNQQLLAQQSTLQKQNSQLLSQITTLQEQISQMQQQLELLLRHRYGKKSEKKRKSF